MDSISLTELADDLLVAAREAASGRAARTVHGGHDRALRETVIAIADGHGLAAHESPGEATLQVVRGRVRLDADPDSWVGAAGEHVVIPARRHALTALEDCVVLLTVVKP